MPRGGRRPGAGRPKGTTKVRKAADQLVTQATLVRVAAGVEVDEADAIAAKSAEAAAMLAALEKLGDEFDAKTFMQAIYKNKHAPLDARFTAAAKVMPFETPKPRINGSASAGGISFRFGRRDDTP